jgi:hypothetical protein
MTSPTFRQYHVTTDPENDWYGIEEYRVKTWGTTCHPIMVGIGKSLRSDTRFTDKEFRKQVVIEYGRRIDELRKVESARQAAATEAFLKRMDELEASALAEIDAMVKEAK